mgnify:CR=1 FL=1
MAHCHEMGATPTGRASRGWRSWLELPANYLANEASSDALTLRVPPELSAPRRRTLLHVGVCRPPVAVARARVESNH